MQSIPNKVFVSCILLGWAWILPSAVHADETAAENGDRSSSRVVILHSYHHGFTWTDNVSKGILYAFERSSERVELRFEFMETRRVNTEAYFRELEHLLQEKYREQQPDVIICSDDHALNFMLNRGEDLFPGVPIVFCSVSGYDPAMRAGRQITGLRETIDVRATLDTALRLHSGTREVAVITDMTRTGRALKKKAEIVFADYRSRVTFNYLEDLTVEELMQEVSKLSEGTIVFLFIFSKDREGRVFAHEENLKRLVQYCYVPIYAVWKFYLGYGIVGGKLTTGEEEGKAVGELALRVLGGEPASAIPLGTSPNKFMFDWEYMSRFGIDEAALPPGSLVINRPFSVYEAYKTPIWIIVGAFAVMVLLVSFLATNVVRRKLAEREKSALEEQLRQAQKMEAIGQLAGGIAHDFNNVLTAILGNAELLKQRLSVDSDHLHLVEDIIKASKRVADRTKQLLAFARRGRIQTRNVDIHKIVQEVYRLLEHGIDRRVEIVLELKADQAIVSGDPSQLQIALLNLGLNARDAMQNGGRLTFATRNITLDEDFCRKHPYEIEEGEYLEVSVTDTGIGMDREVQQRMFEPFFTTKRRGEGTGLGLAGVYGSIKSHRGCILVYSEPGEGTTVKTFLPLAKGKYERLPSVVQGETVHGTGHILIVDDEDSVLRFVAKAVRGLGYQVSVSREGAAAVRYFEEHHHDIDLVVLDLIMPELSGRDVFYRLKVIDPNVNVLLTSGFSHDGMADQLIEEGAVGFLSKPFHIDELSRELARFVRLRSHSG